MDQCSINSNFIDYFMMAAMQKSRDNNSRNFTSQELQQFETFKTKLIKQLHNSETKAFYTLIQLFVVLSNALRIIGINKTTDKNKRNIIKQLFYLTSWIGVFTSILATTSILGNIYLVCDLEFVGLNLERMAFVFDLYVLLCIGVVRFISIRFPFKEIRRKWIGVALSNGFLVTTLFSICMFLLRYLSDQSVSFKRIQFHYKVIVLLILFCLVMNSLLVILLQYSLLKSHKNNNSSSKSDSRNKTKDKKRYNNDITYHNRNINSNYSKTENQIHNNNNHNNNTTTNNNNINNTTNNINNNNNNTTNNNNKIKGQEIINDRSTARKRKAVKRLSLINCVYLLFNSPYVIYVMDFTFNTKFKSAQHLVLKMNTFRNLYNFGSLYSGISALIYIAWDGKIIQFYKKIVLCNARRRTDITNTKNIEHRRSHEATTNSSGKIVNMTSL